MLAAVLLAPPAGQAAQLAGVTMPDAEEVGGAHLTLNGMALRTYSILQIHVYVAGLYMASHTSNPADIIASTQPRLFRFVFTREIGADAARKSWQESFDAACGVPCNVPQTAIDQFLERIPPVRSGDVSTLLFTAHSVEISLNGQPLGRITDPAFERLIISTFIGPHPSEERVKRGLLGLPG